MIYKRLVGYRWTVADIAAKIGKSAASINAALDLQGAPPEVQKLVASGRVSPVDHAAQRGKERATQRDIGLEPKSPRKHQLTRIGELIESSCLGRRARPHEKDPRVAMYTVHVLGIDGVWREYHVFAHRADAERSVTGFEAEGFRAKIYRTASSWPIEEDVQDNHHRRHTWEVSVSGRAVSKPAVLATADAAG